MQAPGATTFGKRAAAGPAHAPTSNTSVSPPSITTDDHGPHCSVVRRGPADGDEHKRRRTVSHAHACPTRAFVQPEMFEMKE